MSLVLDILSWFFLVSGSIFAIIGGFGIVRLPEFFSRLHAGGITDTLGALLIITGCLFQAGSVLVVAKLLMILFFMLITSPTSCHALAKSALASGLRPELDVAQESQS